MRKERCTGRDARAPDAVDEQPHALWIVLHHLPLGRERPQACLKHGPGAQTFAFVADSPLGNDIVVSSRGLAGANAQTQGVMPIGVRASVEASKGFEGAVPIEN